MFYAKDILGKKAPLGPIWIAAHAGDKKLHKRMVLGVNVAKSCDDIMNPEVPLALRVIAFLVNGVVIIYQRQQQVVLDEAKDMMRKIQTLGQPRATHADAGKTKKNGARNSALHLSKYATVTLDEIRIHPGREPGTSTESWNFRTPVLTDPSRGSDGSPYDAYLDLSGDAKHLRNSDLRRHELDLLAMEEPDQFDMPVDFQEEQDLMFWDAPTETPRDLAPDRAATASDKEDRVDADPSAPEDPAVVGAGGVGAAAIHASRAVQNKSKKKRKKKTLALDPREGLIIDSKTYREWLQDPSDLLRGNYERTRAWGIEDLLARPFTGGNTMCEELLTLHRQALDRPSVREGTDRMDDAPMELDEGYLPDPPLPPSSSNEIERMRKASSSSGDGLGLRMESSASGLRSNGKTPRSGMGGPTSADRPNRRLSDLLGTQPHPFSEDLPEDPMQLLLDEGEGASGRDGGILSSQLKHTYVEETVPEQTPRASANMDAIACNVLNFLRSQFRELGRPGADPKRLSLQRLVQDYKLSRCHAARYFYNVCILASNDYLAVIQRRPYDEILLQPGPSL
uniref:Rad21/Rec8-like protein N-terminal domain-containing protein n=1 Tax=Picocystis salinarum TaxID=88271 RepID=A0A6U9RF56_9CHLO|mmetsp:Transcript_9490/g.57882  ORF Transcript_9490/g.57882 Transcript_9490/m.57882 type:complete len:567 (+) Transcript_9490:303-2003(+)